MKTNKNIVDMGSDHILSNTKQKNLCFFAEFVLCKYH